MNEYVVCYYVTQPAWPSSWSDYLVIDSVSGKPEPSAILEEIDAFLGEPVTGRTVSIRDVHKRNNEEQPA